MEILERNPQKQGVIMIHQALKNIRLFHNIKQSDLSVRLGISSSYLSEIESGKKSPSLELLDKYSEIFDIPVNTIPTGSSISTGSRLIPAKAGSVAKVQITK